MDDGPILNKLIWTYIGKRVKINPGGLFFAVKYFKKHWPKYVQTKGEYYRMDLSSQTTGETARRKFMATGNNMGWNIIEVRCLSCDKVTRDEVEISTLNDLDPICDYCGARFRLWIRDNGTRSITFDEIGDNRNVEIIHFKN